MLGVYLAMIDLPSDKELFEAMCQKHMKLMKQTAYTVIKNKNLVDDAVQETLLTMAQKIENFHGLSINQQAALITIITRNATINLIKKENKQHGNGDSVELNDNMIVLVADDAISVRENFEYILSLIKSLEAIYSDVLMLRYVYGYDVKTISEMLGVTIKTIDSRIYRGKKKLSEMMEDDYGLQRNTK